MNGSLLKIRRIITGPLMTNTYILSSEGECMVVDTGGDQAKVIEDITMNHFTPTGVVATHGHFDHVDGAVQIQEKYGVPFYIHSADLEMMKNQGTLIRQMGMDIDITIPSSIRPMNDGTEFKIGSHAIKVLETPGHTMGSIVLYSDGFILSGDTLFRLSVGRTDIGGNQDKLVNSLRIIGSMKESTKIYPGHGDSTDLRFEILNNTFLKNAMKKGSLY
ncbi:MAG: MBL fold metallo-hydrolase [Candidatus Thermoplasmatota archaeon]|jgi:glyoxylase-like metal-dependent hydrolase (beta-lactamase superfamily II)|nr:MBL fold metallo-hydrolase [Candidatus Thermoplasmatota archaeon]MCL5791285.1 MBL fold metallo-hydrolase [Candidatus Thermoplasmatota archaeon]